MTQRHMTPDRLHRGGKIEGPTWTPEPGPAPYVIPKALYERLVQMASADPQGDG